MHILPGAYVNVEQWNASMMKEPYNICFLVIIQVVYHREKVTTLVTEMPYPSW